MEWFMNCIDLGSMFVLVWLIGDTLNRVVNAYLGWRDDNYSLLSENSAYDKMVSLHQCAKNFFSKESLKKSALYERVSSAFSRFHGRVSYFLSIGVILFGIAPQIFDLFYTNCGLNVLFSSYLTYIIFAVLSTIVDIPFSLYSNFVIEEKFGFNMLTKKLFFSDILKELIIGFIESAIAMSMMYYLILGLQTWFGKIDWRSVVILVSIIQIAFIMYEAIYIKFIIPMFNKLTPLEDGELKTKVIKMMVDFGYNPNGVFIMDASKRSKHSNAYCTGWGKTKKLVIYDTLLNNFTEDEILAIIGHELGHAKRHHLIFGRILGFIETVALLSVICYLMYDLRMFHAFGWTMVNENNVTGFGIIAFYLAKRLFESVEWIGSGLDSYLSRLMEYEADRYSCKYTEKVEPMITALFKLYGENLSYPLADTWYENWIFSHPGLVKRVEALKKLSQDTPGSILDNSNVKEG